MNARGFSLVESLVALTVVGIAAASMLPAFLTQVDANTKSRMLTGAVSAAEMELEDLRLQDPELLPTTGSLLPKLIVVGDTHYDVVTHFCEEVAMCWDTTRHIRIEVRLDGKSIHDIETVFTQVR